MGRKKLYHTKEEQDANIRAKSKRYYERNREAVKARVMLRYLRTQKQHG